MKKLFAFCLAATMMMSLVACSNSEGTTTTETTTAEPTIAETIKIGMICSNDENNGYDAAHIAGIKEACAALGIDESQIVFKYSIVEDETTYDTAVDLAESGCDVIIAISYGHQPYLQQVASEYDDITFIAMTGDTAATSGLDNLKNIFPYTYESRYVSGVVAGMKLAELMEDGTVTEAKIGYIGAYPFAEVISAYTAFLLGIQTVVPEATMEVTFINSWYDLVAETEAANALISRGNVIISQHHGSTAAPSAVQAALEEGSVAYSVGYNVDMLTVAPDAALTSAQNDWGKLYELALGLYVNGEEIPADLAAGIAEGAVKISALGDSCAEGTQEVVDATWAGLADGSINVFDTATFTVNGETVTSAMALDTDGDWVPDTGEAIIDGVFVESYFRSAPYFELTIDGITLLN